jgi:hypothetical protein
MRNHGLSITLTALFVVFMGAQTLTGWYVFNDEQREHRASEVTLRDYLGSGHFMEATAENWESEFLQMAAFVMLTTFLYHRGSAESRRPHVIELVDADPRDFADQPGVPWPVRRGGGVLWLYERSLGLAFVVLFALSFAGHAVGGWLGYAQEQTAHGQGAPTFTEYLASSRFWFESMQNWQSEFIAVAAIVGLSIFLRQRGSAESKPVAEAHRHTGA